MQNFRQSVRSAKVLLGTFIKTASHQTVEILGVAGFDFAIIDCEHAPFGPGTLDVMALAARAAALPTLVRVPEIAPAAIGQALDLGFSGVVIPHVKGVDTASAALDAAKYARGARGFSPSTRAGNFGALASSDYRATADSETSVWCQIEDQSALAQLDAIAAIDDVDCLFLGRADLAQSLNVESQSHPLVAEAVAATAAAGVRHGRAVGIFISDVAEVPDLLALGITVFVCGSDQSLLRAQGRKIRNDLTDILAARPPH